MSPVLDMLPKQYHSRLILVKLSHVYDFYFVFTVTVSSTQANADGTYRPTFDLCIPFTIFGTLNSASFHDGELIGMPILAAW